MPGLSIPDSAAFLGQEVIALFVLISVKVVFWEGLRGSDAKSSPLPFSKNLSFFVKTF